MAFSVDFIEMHGYPQSHWENGIFTAVRKLKCAWADRDELAIELASTNGNPPNCVYPYSEGPAYIPSQSQFGATAVALKIEPLPASVTNATQSNNDHLAVYESAMLTVTYSNAGPIVATGGYLITERLLPRTEFHNLNDETLYWYDSTEVTPAEAPGRLASSLVYEIILHRWSTVPNFYYDWVGYVNSNPVTLTSFGRVFSAGQLLYQPGPVRTSFGLASGWSGYDVTMRFAVHPSHWNYAWRTLNSQYEPIYTDSEHSIPYGYPATAMSFW